MSWVTVAVVGGSLIAGAISTKKAGDQASEASIRATQIGIDAELAMFNQARADYAPWRIGGAWALGQPSKIYEPEFSAVSKQVPTNFLAQGSSSQWGTWPDDPVLSEKIRAWEAAWPDAPHPFGNRRGMTTVTERNLLPAPINPETGQPYKPGEKIPGTGLIGKIERGHGEFVPEETPGYKFGFEEFIRKPLERRAAARGQYWAPSTTKAISDRAMDYAELSYQNHLDRWYQSLTPYQSLAQLGMTAAGGMANVAMNNQAGQYAYQNALNQGNIGAQQTAAYGGLAQSGFQNYLDYSMMRKMFGGGGRTIGSNPTISQSGINLAASQFSM
jgi:hypothetical protein